MRTLTLPQDCTVNLVLQFITSVIFFHQIFLHFIKSEVIVFSLQHVYMIYLTEFKHVIGIVRKKIIKRY